MRFFENEDDFKKAIEEIVKVKLEKREKIKSLDNPSLPHNDRINHIINGMNHSIEHLLHEVNQIGYLNDSPYENKFSSEFTELKEHLDKFMVWVREDERAVVFRRNGVLYEFSELHGQGCEIYLSKIQDEEGYINSIVNCKKDEIIDINREISNLLKRKKKIKNQINLFKSI